MNEYLLLKWGNLKGWKIESEAATAAFHAYVSSGDNAAASMAMVRLDTAEKQALCGLIDAINGPITNDWSGEDMTKDEAKKYVLEYGRSASADTRPQGGDAKQAPFTSGAVPEGQTPNPSGESQQ